MESDWRFNVWNYGMQLSTWVLCARRFPPIPGVLLVKRSDTPTRYWLYQLPAPGQVPVVLSNHPILPTNPRFPYGILVNPD